MQTSAFRAHLLLPIAAFRAVGASARRTRMGLAAIAGGGALIAGAWLPWLSLFAGLYPMRGIIGLNGQLIFVAGLAITVLGAVLLARDVRAASLMLGGAGVLLLGLVASIFAGIRHLTNGTGDQAMLVPRAGVGFWVVVLGAVVTAAAPLLGRKRHA